MSTDYLHTPKRACPVLEAMRRGLMDVLPYRRLQELQALPPAPSGTADDGITGVRAYMALDWLIRVYLPGFLELSPACREDAERVRKLDRIVDLPSAERAGPVVQQSRAAARAAAIAAADAAAAADDAVDDAVMRAVTDAAWAGAAAAWAGAAAWAAAWAAAAAWADDAITIAAWTTAETARLAAVSGAVSGAVRAAAAAAAATAASDAARGVPEDDVRHAAVLAAWDVARGALGPTIESLQGSAITLYADMIDARIRGGAR